VAYFIGPPYLRQKRRCDLTMAGLFYKRLRFHHSAKVHYNLHNLLRPVTAVQ